MKTTLLNKSTLFLAFLAVAFWCFYFWQEKENEEFIEYAQELAIESSNIKASVIYSDNHSFLEEVKRSFIDSAGYSENIFKNFNPEKKLYHSIPISFQNYLESVSNFENEISYKNMKTSKFLFNKLTRQNYIDAIKYHLDKLQNQSLCFATNNLYKVDWKEKDNFKIWLALHQQREQIITIADSIFKENKKQFPTSYSSNHFEGYSTLIPDYENQKMIIKVFYFQSDTKYGTEFQKSLPKYLIASYNHFELGDSTFHPMQNPMTSHIFDKVGDTTLYLYFLNKDTGKRFAEHSNYGIEFRVIPKKLIQ